jgi:acyl-coenzyme A thioesterase PaaI-like protein
LNLSELLSSMRSDVGSVEVTVGAEWLQGRSVFGGLQAAVALQAMRTLVPVSAMPLRTLQMTFIAPIETGVVRATARVLRSGKNTAHVEARLEHADGVHAIAIGVFGIARESIVQRTLLSPPPAAKGQVLPFVPGMTPSFMQQFDIALLDGALPFANQRILRTAFELGLRDSGAMSESHVLAFADFMPPVALSWMTKPTPGSSLTWMLELLQVDSSAQPLVGWRTASEMIAAADGYTSQSTTLWAPDGTAVALSRQTMVVFG